METQNDSDVKVSTYLRLANEVFIPYELLPQAWCECIELQHQPMATWMEGVVKWLEKSERVEVVVTSGDSILGACVLMQELNDVHVGTCLAVVLNYVRPSARNTGVVRKLMAEALRIARASSNTMLVYTHRLGDYEYKSIYKRIP